MCRQFTFLFSRITKNKKQKNKEGVCECVLLLRENAIAHKIHTHYSLILSTSCGKNIKEKKQKKNKRRKEKNIESMRERRREKEIVLGDGGWWIERETKEK
jgi:hypothetical protein